MVGTDDPVDGTDGESTVGGDPVERSRTDGGVAGDRSGLEAARYPDGSVTYPPHPVGPDGEAPVGTVDLSDRTATVVTWTTSTAPPPGVPAPNHLAIVEFDVDGQPVRALGQLTTDDVEIGDEVEPVYAAELREPGAGIREPESQDWDGYRFRPVE